LAGSILNPLDSEPRHGGSPADGIVPAANLVESATAVRLAHALRDEGVRILANWSMRVATMPVFRALPELALDELQQDMPQLFDAILRSVSVSQYELDPAPLDEASVAAEAHGRKRASAIPVEALMTEFQALQREVRNALWRLSPEVAVTLIHELDDRLNDVFEAAERSAIVAWVERRSQLDRLGDA
jgi:hypothetical protein